jgi:hypothetical protein
MWSYIYPGLLERSCGEAYPYRESTALSWAPRANRRRTKVVVVSCSEAFRTSSDAEDDADDDAEINDAEGKQRSCKSETNNRPNETRGHDQR